MTTVYDFVLGKANNYNIDLNKYFSRNKMLLMKRALVDVTEDLEPGDYVNDDPYSSAREVYEILFHCKYNYKLLLIIYAGEGTPGCCQTFYLQGRWTRLGVANIDSDPEISLDEDQEKGYNDDGCFSD